MAAITAKMVADLRAKTDAPMMECKKALTEADGDIVRAEEILRVKLGNQAGKAASRDGRRRHRRGRQRPDRRDGRSQLRNRLRLEERDLPVLRRSRASWWPSTTRPTGRAVGPAAGDGGLRPDGRRRCARALIGKIGENMSIRRFRATRRRRAGPLPARRASGVIGKYDR